MDAEQKMLEEKKKQILEEMEKENVPNQYKRRLLKEIN